VGKCAPCEDRTHELQVSTADDENDFRANEAPVFYCKFLISVLIGSLFTTNNPALCLTTKMDDTISARAFESAAKPNFCL